MKAWLWPVLLALSIATAAHAGGIEDGNAGLDALNNGNYDEAIRLFTRALRPGELKAEDKEFAYLNRGKAYAAKGEIPQAIADFRQAVRLRPDDADAQSALQEALANQAGGGEEAAAPTPQGAAGDPWGLLSAMVTQQYYWLQVPGHDPHESYASYTWFTPQQALTVSVRDKKSQSQVFEYKLDAKTGEIIFAGLVSENQEYGTIKASPNGVTAYSYINNAPTRFVSRRLPDGSIQQTTQTFVGGHWTDGVTVRLVATSVDELTTDGLIKAKKKR